MGWRVGAGARSWTCPLECGRPDPRGTRGDQSGLRELEAKPEHLVFREFIERDRNNILKQYRMNVLDSSEVAVVVGDPEAGYTTGIFDENLYKPMKEGFRVDEDARDVYREAIQWWDEQLTRLEAALNRADQ